MPERLKLILPVLTLILGCTTLIFGTMSAMQSVRLTEMKQQMTEIRVDVKALQVATTRSDSDLDHRVTILETSIKADTSTIREAVARLEGLLNKHVGTQ